MAPIHRFPFDFWGTELWTYLATQKQMNKRQIEKSIVLVLPVLKLCTLGSFVRHGVLIELIFE